MWSRPLPRLASGVWAALKLLVVGGVVYLGSCASARTILQTAPDKLPRDFTIGDGLPLPPAQARALAESEIYGRIAKPGLAAVEAYGQPTMVFDGTATLYQHRLALGYPGTEATLDIVTLLPTATPDAPLIVSQNFCPNDAVIPIDGVRRNSENSMCGSGGVLGSVFTFFFGRHIVTPPLEAIVAQGYGFVAMYPSQVIPDNAERGQQALDALFLRKADRPGALAVWAALTPVVADALETEFGPRPVIAVGHSRFGKTALLSAAWFDEIDGAIAHQSGTLGASDMTDVTGEPLDALLRSYPHWGNRRLQSFAERPAALPVQPSDVLAATGGKPVLLGNAKRDTWSDPLGAFREAKEGWQSAFTAQRPGDFQPSAVKAFWQRPGTHGVTKEDWEAFLAWMGEQDWKEWRSREDLNPQPAD